MHPLAVVLAVLAGAELGGVAGVFLCVPVVAILSAAYRQYLAYARADGHQRVGWPTRSADNRRSRPNPCLISVDRELHARRHAGLVEDLRHVVLDRLSHSPNVSADFGIRLALDHCRDTICRSRSVKTGLSRGRAWRSPPGLASGGKRPVDRGPAQPITPSGHRADALDQRFRLSRLQNHSADAEQQRLEQLLVARSPAVSRTTAVRGISAAGGRAPRCPTTAASRRRAASRAGEAATSFRRLLAIGGLADDEENPARIQNLPDGFAKQRSGRPQLDTNRRRMRHSAFG